MCRRGASAVVPIHEGDLPIHEAAEYGLVQEAAEFGALEASRTGGVEWWVQYRLLSGGEGASNIGLHWDTDEQLKAATGEHLPPWVATVTYLGARRPSCCRWPPTCTDALCRRQTPPRAPRVLRTFRTRGRGSTRQLTGGCFTGRRTRSRPPPLPLCRRPRRQCRRRRCRRQSRNRRSYQPPPSMPPKPPPSRSCARPSSPTLGWDTSREACRGCRRRWRHGCSALRPSTTQSMARCAIASR